MPRPPVGMAWPSASSRAERSTLGALLDQPFMAVRIDLRWGFCRDRTSSLLQAALRLAAATRLAQGLQCARKVTLDGRPQIEFIYGHLWFCPGRLKHPG